MISRRRDLQAALNEMQKERDAALELATHRPSPTPSSPATRLDGPSLQAERQRAIRLGGLPTALADRPYRSMRKLADYRIAESIGVRCPEVLGVWPEPESIPWHSFDGRLALKPVRGANARGVWLLDCVEGTMQNLWSRRAVTPDEISNAIVADFEACGVPMAHFAERLVVDPAHGGPSDDWKAFVFGERVGLWAQIRRTDGAAASSVRFWGPQWQDLGEIRSTGGGPKLDRSLERPMFHRELSEAAERVGRAWRRPLMRFDFFQDERGPVFGETTPNPGTFRDLIDSEDRRLGELVELAVAELGLG